MYAIPSFNLTEHQTLIQAAQRVPHGIICLLSALSFHDLTTQSPFEVWMAIDPKARLPKEEIIPLRIVRFSGRSLTAGVEKHSINGVKVSVYNPAKTVADCFKYRNKIGLDVAMEALRDCWRKKKATSDELWRSAKVCRVARIMRPYLESQRDEIRNKEYSRVRQAASCESGTNPERRFSAVALSLRP